LLTSFYFLTVELASPFTVQHAR